MKLINIAFHEMMLLTAFFTLLTLPCAALSQLTPLNVTHLIALAPFQSNPHNTDNSTIDCINSGPAIAESPSLMSCPVVLLHDPNTPNTTVNCHLTWLPPLPPPSFRNAACNDTSVQVYFRTGTWNGVGDFQISITHFFHAALYFSCSLLTFSEDNLSLIMLLDLVRQPTLVQLEQPL